MIAALLPIRLAVFAIIVALGLTAIIGQAFELVFFVTMIGLAVGIDYSLLIVSRFGEEMNKGQDKLEAVERAGDAAGRTALFSGVTVVIALCGMLIAPASFFQSLAVGAILVVIVALAATLTLLPAAVALLGTGVNRLRIPFVGMGNLESSEATKEGFWEATTRVVTRFPVISIIVTGVPMLVVAFFYFQIETGLNGVDTFPEGAQTREAFFVLEEKFPFGLLNPTEIVIDGNVNDPQVQGAVAKLQESLSNDPRFPIPPILVSNPSGDLALLTLPIPGESRSRANVEAVTNTREQYIKYVKKEAIGQSRDPTFMLIRPGFSLDTMWLFLRWRFLYRKTGRHSPQRVATNYSWFLLLGRYFDTKSNCSKLPLVMDTGSSPSQRSRIVE